MREQPLGIELEMHDVLVRLPFGSPAKASVLQLPHKRDGDRQDPVFFPLGEGLHSELLAECVELDDLSEVPGERLLRFLNLGVGGLLVVWSLRIGTLRLGCLEVSTDCLLALKRLWEVEPFDRVVAPAPVDGAPGFSEKQLAWLLTHSPAETVVLKPAA